MHHRHPRQSRKLPRAQDRRGLDQVHLDGRLKPRHPPRRAQDIRHQGPAPRPQLGQHRPRGRAPAEPGLRQRQPDKLAEHLADLRRGGEIARRPQRVAGGVIAQSRVGQAFGHVVGDRQRPARPDPPGQHLGERPSHVPRRLSAQPITSTPTMTIGSDRSWPMVMPRKTWPNGLSGVMNCASASRKYSTMKRDTP